jgi:2-keto-4-pentenoate hydratase
MTPDDFSAARAALVASRRQAVAIAECPPQWRPADLAEANRLQAAVIDALGGSRGWKVGALTVEQRSAMGVTQPVAGALLAASMHDTRDRPALLRLADFIAPKVECEFAFQLRHDLPARASGAYSHVQVAHAIESVRLSIEIVDPRWPSGSGSLAEIADAFNNGGFIAGPAIGDWLALDFAAIAIALTFEAPGETPRLLAEGSGRAILDGDPLGAVVLLANAQPEAGPGLRAGDIVTTGSCTGAPRLPGRGFYRAEFAGLGSVAFRVD